MEAQRPRHQPPTYVSHNPKELKLPSAPRTDISHAHATAEITLPDLKTVLSPNFQESSIPSNARSMTNGHGSPHSVRSLPRIDPGPQDIYNERRSTEVAVASPSEFGSAMSVDEGSVKSPSVSMDERIAAEALSGLGGPGFTRTASAPQAPNGTSRSSTAQRQAAYGDQEPLLKIIANAHPWVSATMSGSLSAYSTTKHYSPRFVQYTAQLLENKIALPVATTVGTVGRVTGVESGVRWYYGGQTRRPSDLERGEEGPPAKRRLTEEEMSEHSERSHALARFRSGSQDFTVEPLPAYGASKPPSYRSEASPIGRNDRDQTQSWSSQVLVMTSGLGVALSVTSRNSLKVCLSFLAKQAEHITTVMNALKLVLQQYDGARDAYHQRQSTANEKGYDRPQTPDHDEAARRLAEIIKTHSEDIWKTLQSVVTSVSNYAGGALPENARHFVKTQLMSLPHRWRFVSDQQIGEGETSRGAHRMVAFATEGLDMIGQVSETMRLTLESAEQWLERVGRRREGGREAGRGGERPDAVMVDVEKH